MRIFLLLLIGISVVTGGCEEQQIEVPSYLYQPSPNEPTPTPVPVTTVSPLPIAMSTPTPSSTPSATPEPSSSSLVINDPLTNGQSVGIVAGGWFIPGQGYHLPANWANYIAYETGMTGANIRLEFDATGYIPMEGDDADGKMVILRILDSPWTFPWLGSDQWQAGYSIFELRKKGRYYADADGMHLKFGAGQTFDEYRSYEGDSPSGHPFAWNPNTTYHWLVLIQNNTFRITRNGAVIFSGSSAAFRPTNPLNILIGGTPTGASGPRDVTYANVKVSIP